MNELKLSWQEIFKLEQGTTPALQGVLDIHPTILQEELGTLEAVTARIYIQDGGQPEHFNARSVPYAPREKKNQD